MPAYDFTRLSAFDFEELALDLLQADWKTGLEIFTPGPDAGIDLRAFSDTKRETIIQCKHTPHTSFAKLLSHLKKEELPKVRALAPNRYVLFTSLGLTPANTKALVQLFKPYLKRQTDVYHRDRINALLRRHKKVETANFKLWLPSVAVLQRVLHNAEHAQTQFEIDRVCRKVPLFVQNDAFPRAQKILHDSRVVVISGEPGIGKTTLAEMLLLAHLEQGFEPVVIEGGVEEGKRLFDSQAKQIFYFDDFLGETFLQQRPELLAKNQDAALIHFMQAIRTSQASRFILTTREHILRTALDASEKLRHGSLINHRFLLELSDYTFGQKARILYNHLYFSDLPAEYKAAILENEFYFEVIRHRNFNPRLVEWLSGYARVKTVPAENYQQHVRALLDNPREIWLHAFENQISEAARSLLFTLAVLRWGAETDVLQASWLPLHQLKSRKYNFPTTANDFRKALNELESSFLRISEQKVSFLNPSIRQFIQLLLRTNRDYACDIIESSSRFSQLRSLRDIQSAERSDELASALVPNGSVVEALRRVIGEPYLRWQHDSTGKLIGTYIDDSPDTRLRTIVKWADEAQSDEMLSIMILAYEHLQKTLRYVPGFLDVLRTIEDCKWVYKNGGDKLHRALMDSVLAQLSNARTYEWQALFNYRANSSPWIAEDEARFVDSYQIYRRKGVYDELESYDELSDLESMRDSLRDIQKSHNQVFKKAIKKLNVSIERTRKSTDDVSEDDYQPIAQSKRATSEDVEEVRRLFGSLG
ncbi:restriction endonuclease [Bradyrhizobium iriomotense]|uniref:Novel STAND NTPase 3 domain-containing protein n=1 Tax=Bradyrhizobium iriomotense TaxID=441950 RepID=A0ABQ6AP49_9BRAD|nr:restriction endonuclease [Bradyrhizobium iriomotense]GLR84039.1 hypothetical protein GCM10007857_07490 [Bradyrhizobium iriomotense]